MSHVTPKPYFPAAQRALTDADTIEWEEMPSFAAALTQRLVNRPPRGADDAVVIRTAPVTIEWEATLPAPLEAAPVSGPFGEPFEGLATREVLEPDVFLHFFGPMSRG